MELCPNCGRMTAERSHYTGIIICYSKNCLMSYSSEDQVNVICSDLGNTIVEKKSRKGRMLRFELV